MLLVFHQVGTSMMTSRRRLRSMKSALIGAGSIGIAGLVANLANVLTTFALSHLLASRGYGSFNILVYLFLVLTMPGYAVIVAVVRQLTIWKSTKDFKKAHHSLHRWRLYGLGVTAIAFLVSLVFGEQISSSLSIESSSPIMPILVAGAFWLVLSIDRGTIQASLAYTKMARNLLVEGLFRTGGTLVLVGLGDGVQGAMIGILISALAADIDARLSIARLSNPRNSNLIVRESSSVQDGSLDDIEKVVSGESPMPHFTSSRYKVDFMIGLLGLAMLAALAGIDVVVLGKYYPSGSGSYAAIAVVAKVLFFAALILSGYLLPEATSRWHRGESAISPLLLTLGLLALCGVILEIFALVGSSSVMHLVFPQRVLHDLHELPLLVGAMAFLGLSVVLVYYFMGIGRGEVLILLLLALGILIGLLIRCDGNPWRTVKVDFFLQLGLVSCLLGYLGLVSIRTSNSAVETSNG